LPVGLALTAAAAVAAGGFALVSGWPSSGHRSPSASPTATPVPTPSEATPTPSASPSEPGPSDSAASPSPTPSATPSSSPEGSPLLGFVETEGGYAYYAEDGTVVAVQQVPGLRIELKGGKAQYVALAGNRYNLVSGSYAGEFKPNVTLEQADGSSTQSGGIVAVGPVAARLISDRLASIKNPADRWVIALPVDIRSQANDVNVTFDGFGLRGWSETPRVLVRYSGPLPVTNIIPANDGYHVLVEGVGATRWQVIDPTRLDLPTTDIDARRPMNELLIFGDGAPNTRRNVAFDRRVAIGQKMLSAADEVSVSLVVADSRRDITPDRILTVDDVPVFVAAL
jgi:hypothetical protein